MRTHRMPDLLLAVGAVSLAFAIGQGQHQSAQARDRRDPVLWQVRIYDAAGRLLRSRELWGAENQVLSLTDPTGLRPRVGLQLLPLGLPNDEIELELRFSVDGQTLPPLQGLRVTPGKTVKLDVPGQPLRIELRALRSDPARPLVS
jgi:hypothetical protein